MPVSIEPISERILSELVDVHFEAFKGYMNASIGRDYVRRFLSWFAHREGGIALAAVADGRVVGYVVGAPVGYDRVINHDMFWVVARSIALRPRLLFQKRFLRRLLQRARQLLSQDGMPRAAVPDLPEPVMSLVGIAVSESGRGKGVGRALMNEFESRCRHARAKAMRLSVYATNAAARTLYEHAGWTLFVPDGSAEAVYYHRVLEQEDSPP